MTLLGEVFNGDVQESYIGRSVWQLLSVSLAILNR